MHLAIKHPQTILPLILTNSEELLPDFSLIGSNLLARGASKAADGLRPDQEPSDEWTTAPQATDNSNVTLVAMKLENIGF